MNIETLIKDIFHVLNTGEGWTDEIANWVAEDQKQTLKRQMTPRNQTKGSLRMSGLGTPCERKLWYEVNKVEEKAQLPATTKGVFLQGDMTESLLIGLIMASGHKVEGMQDKMSILGVKGHRDCIIDGVLIDIKSTSGRAFDKFKKGNLREDDPFGYLSQLSSYLYAGQDDPLIKEKSRAGFLAVNRDRFNLALDMYDLTEEMQNKEEEVQRKIDLVHSETPPDRAFDPIPMGKAGNEKLSTHCSYCDFKNTCFPELRTFLYSSGPVYLTKVEKEPDVWEIK